MSNAMRATAPVAVGVAHRRLIVNADDFGRSPSINQAIIRAHREGILTTASLMVNEAAFDEAVGLARDNPSMGVGLHLTLLCGHSALPRETIPGLVTQERKFTDNPPGAGFRYFFRRGLRAQLRAEIHAQFEKFRATGLVLDHVNGHLHLHLHPTVFSILMDDAVLLGIQRVRLTRDPFRLNLRLASGRLGDRMLHAVIFHSLAARARPVLEQRGLRHTRCVFGLLQNGRVDEAYVARLLPLLPGGDSELYSHPSLDEAKAEFDALISPAVKAQVRELGIRLIRYQDL
jgi:hopanoid biosynthesis associated protein HpnK